MKIVCDKCNSRYSLSDEKVRNIGRSRFGVRCKTCGNLIRVTVIEAPIEPTPDEVRGFTPAPPPPKERGAVDIFSDADLEGEFGRAFGGSAAERTPVPAESAVRASAAPARESGAGVGPKKKREDTKLYDYREFQALLKEKGLLTTPSKPKVEQEPEGEWYLALDGNQSAPCTRKAAEAKIGADPALAENGFAWRDGFADWLPIVDVPEFRDVARKAMAARPAPPPIAAPPPITRSPEPARLESSPPAESAAKEVEPVVAKPAAAGGIFSAVEHPPETDDAKPRNEGSVLFSLDALKASTMAATESVPTPSREDRAPGHDAATVSPTPPPATSSPAKSIATPIQMPLSPRTFSATPRTAAKKSNALVICIAVAVVGGGGAAIAYFAVQSGNRKLPVETATTPEPESRRAEPESAARATPQRADAPAREAPVLAATAIEARPEARTPGDVGARDAVRLPLPESGTAATAAAVAAPSGQDARTVTPDSRQAEATRAAVASAAADDDEPRDRRRKRGKRRRGRETTAVSTSVASASTAREESSSSVPAAPTGDQVPRASAAAARGDAVLDDILGGGSSAPAARSESPRASARRVEARTPAPVRRADPPPEPPPAPRQDPPREPARAAADPSLPRTLDGSEIKSRVERNRQRVNLCYSSTVADKSEKKGRLVVSFTIERNGRPSRVSVDRAGYWGTELASCVTTAFSKLRFGSFFGDPIEVRFPFVLGDF